MENSDVRWIANTPTTASASAVDFSGSGGGREPFSVVPLRGQYSNPATLDLQYTAAEIRSFLAHLQQHLPTEVDKWIVHTGIDSTEKPAIWVRAVLLDEYVDIDTHITIRNKVFDFVRKRCNFSGWVYVNFRTTGVLDNPS